MSLLTASIGAVVGDKLKSLFTTIATEFGEEVKQFLNTNMLEYQIEEHARNYCTKTLLHRLQPKELMSFYQPLFITPYGKNHTLFNERKNTKRIPTDSIKEVFSQRQFITLIGSAGSGKSTIVKYLFLNAIDTNFKIPVKVELRYLNDFNGTIIEFITDRIFKLNKLATHARIIERLMSSGDFVFFLDGYDEIVTSKKEKITKEIDDLVKRYNKNFYLLTSRPYTEIDLLPSFHNFEVCDLSDDEINEFIRKQISVEEKEICDKIIEAVNSKENVSYKSFLSNPLLLSMFILTFQSYSSIPQKRTEFYSQVFDALYSVHDSMSKLAFVREKHSGLPKEQIVEVLKLFSFLSYFEEKFLFSGIYFTEKLEYIKEKKKNILFENSKLLYDLQVAIGILNKEGTDYTFPHRSLQEYFAAMYIFSLNDDNKKSIYSKIIKLLTGRHINFQSRINFYLLLSEIDERNVIKYVLIPYFQDFISNTSVEETNYEAIYDNFSRIYNAYEAFRPILKSRQIEEARIRFSELFQSSMQEYARAKQPRKRIIPSEDFRKKLAIENIQPFLKELIPTIKQKKEELEIYLSSESKSDSEIISLI